MKILYITNMYPSDENPYYGIFVKEQIEYFKTNTSLEIDIIILKGKNLFVKYFNIINIYSNIKKFNPDIIHIHYGLTGLPILFIYPFIYKKKIVTTFHGSDINGSKFVNLISLLIAKISTTNIAVSKEIFLKLQKYTKNTIWLPCGIDESFLVNNTELIREAKIIFPSSPNRDVKNFSLFKNVINVLENRYQLKPEIIIFENKTREEIKKILLSSQCMLLTSKSEGSPQVIKEAIACNLPIVSTDVGDVSFLIKDLDNCYIENTAEEIASKVALIFKSEIKTFPEEIKRKLGNKFVCAKLIEIYKTKGLKC